MALYNITDQSQIIKVSAIKNACDNMDVVAEAFERAAVVIEDINNEVFSRPEYFSVDNATMSESFRQVADGLRSAKSNVNGFTNLIRNTAETIEGTQYKELVNYQNQQNQG